MFSNKLAKCIQELLAQGSFKSYYVDQVPSFDQAKNPDGFVCWDIEEIRPMHNTEGIEYSGTGLAVNFELSITVYHNLMATRNSIEKLVLDIFQPVSSGKRRPLREVQLTNGFVRYIIWTSTSEFPIPKTGQSNAEMSASVLLFNSSISVVE